MVRILFCITLLSGCSSIVGTPTQKDAYTIVERVSGNHRTQNSAKNAGIEGANDICTSIDKKANIVSVYKSSPPYILGRRPVVEVVFTCE